MNLRTPYDVLCSSFRTNWRSCKKDGKDYTFDVLCDLLIKDQQKLLDEGKLGSKHQACSKARASRTTRREDVLAFLVVNMNVSTIKLN